MDLKFSTQPHSLAVSLLLSFCILCYVSFSIGRFSNTSTGPTSPAIIVSHDTTSLNDWELFIMGLAVVESDLFPDVVSGAGAAGVLQQMPSFVDEANRLIGSSYYSYSDRFDPTLSLEMFNSVMCLRGIRGDIPSAIRLYNPGAGDWYADRVYSEIAFVKRYEALRSLLLNCR